MSLYQVEEDLIARNRLFDELVEEKARVLADLKEKETEMINRNEERVIQLSLICPLLLRYM